MTDDVLDRYEHGPGAPQRATRKALLKIDATDPSAVILVEGISDQVAIDTLAARRGIDFDREGVVVLPVGGAQAIAHHLGRFGPRGEDLDLAGMCDRDAVDTFCEALTAAGLGDVATEADMAEIGFSTCHGDLEDELIRAAGSDLVLQLLEDQGELKAFRTMQKQGPWRDRPIDAQLRRFVASKARRGLRYAHLLVDTMSLADVPIPICAVLDTICPGRPLP